MKKAALIMAGGRGERFWPRSRKNMPKQFLSLTDDGKTMLQLTVERILPLVNIEDIFIVTNRDYKNLVKKQIPKILEENILCEPIGRNTAACIGLGAVHMRKKYEDAIMIVLPADHLIKMKSIFLGAIADACYVAEHDLKLVTLGITPDSPEIDYGYIKFNPNKTFGRAFEVYSFKEKPDLETAKLYLSSEQYLWNSGMFIWKVSSILSCIEKYLPNIYLGLCNIKDAVGKENYREILEMEYQKFPSISIDYGIMEKAGEIFTISSSFGWDDVGSWLALERLKTSNEFGNIVSGNVVTIDSKNCIVQAENKLLTVIGLNDIIVVDSKDAILICNKDNTGEIKKALEYLRMCKLEQYL